MLGHLKIKLLKLVLEEKVAVEDIAILCIDHKLIDFLKINLPQLVTGKEGLTKAINNFVIVNAEDFATKCSKIKQKGRKRRHSSDSGIQKKFLMIDTVRRFKGLEAEVTMKEMLPVS